MMDWINGQSNLMDSIRFLVENEIRAHGVRNLQLFIPAERGVLVAGGGAIDGVTAELAAESAVQPTDLQCSRVRRLRCSRRRPILSVSPVRPLNRSRRPQLPPAKRTLACVRARLLRSRLGMRLWPRIYRLQSLSQRLPHQPRMILMRTISTPGCKRELNLRLVPLGADRRFFCPYKPSRVVLFLRGRSSPQWAEQPVYSFSGFSFFGVRRRNG